MHVKYILLTQRIEAVIKNREVWTDRHSINTLNGNVQL